LEWASLLGSRFREQSAPKLGTLALDLRSSLVAFPTILEGHTMLRQPIHGFAKRVDDTVARAMAILQSRPDSAVKPGDGSLSGSNGSQKAT
jgi:hypothetical protein